MAHPWLKMFFNAMCRGMRRRMTRDGRAAVGYYWPGIELLENRITPTITSAWSAGLLTVVSDAADSIAIEINGGMIQINGADPGSGPLAAAAVANLSITSGPGGGNIDLSQLVSGTLPNFQSGQIQGNGVTTLIAPASQANTWYLTGQNQGDLNGTAQFNLLNQFTGVSGGIAFQDVQNITGGQQTDLIKYVQSGALLTGNINELAGGNLTFYGDVLTIQGSVSTVGGSITVGGGPATTVTLQGALDTQGGTVDVAGSSVTVEGMITTEGGSVNINDSSVLGSGGSATLQGNIDTSGGNLTVYADTITLNTQSGAVLLSTQDVTNIAFGGPAIYQSVGNSGDISFSGVNITLGSDSGSMGSAELDSQATGATYTAGAITLTVLQEAGAGTGGGFNFPILPDLDSTSTSITLNDAMVLGGVVTFTATSENLHATTSAPNNSTPTIVQTGINFLENFQLLGGATASNAATAINLGPASAITASSFTAMAQGISDAESSPMAVSGVDIAMVFVITNASVNAAGHITTTGDITLDSMAHNTLLAKALENGNSGANSSIAAGVAAAVAIENSTSSAVVASTAQLNAGGNLTVQANTQNDKALQVVTTTGTDGNVGIGIGISYTTDTTTAAMNGQAVVHGAALIQANEVKEGVGTSQFFIVPTLLTGVAVNAGVGTSDTGNLINNAQGGAMAATVTPLISKISSLLGSQSAPTAAQVPAVQAAASVAIDVETNTATASIGANAALSVLGDLTVDANTNDRPNVIASSGISQSGPNQSSSVGPTEFAGSFAVAIGQYTNTANAFIDSNATANSGGNLSVTAETNNDFELSYGFNVIQALEQKPDFMTDQPQANDVTLNPNDIVECEDNNSTGKSGHWYQFVGAGTLPDVDLTTTNFANAGLWKDVGVLGQGGWSYKASNAIKTFTTYLDNTFGIDNNLADTWSQATVAPSDNQQAANIAVTGCITWLTLNQTSTASINNGAQINQSPMYRDGSQSVFVLATDSNSSLNLGGTVQVPGLTGSNKNLNFGANGTPSTGTQSGQDSVGASAVVVKYSDTVTATIAADVNLYADSLDVDAETVVGNFSTVISGVSTSGSVAFNGVVSVVMVNDMTLAQIAAGSQSGHRRGPRRRDVPQPQRRRHHPGRHQSRPRHLCARADVHA